MGRLLHEKQRTPRLHAQSTDSNLSALCVHLKQGRYRANFTHRRNATVPHWGARLLCALCVGVQQPGQIWPVLKPRQRPLQPAFVCFVKLEPGLLLKQAPQPFSFALAGVPDSTLLNNGAPQINFAVGTSGLVVSCIQQSSEFWP